MITSPQQSAGEKCGLALTAFPTAPTGDSGTTTAFPLHIGILMDHPSPHMVALLDSLAARTDCTIEIVYCSRSARGRSWGAPPGRLPHRFLPRFRLGKILQFNRGTLGALEDVDADVWILNSVYSSVTTLLAAWWLGRKQLPMAFMNEPIRIRGPILTMLKALPQHIVLKRAAAILATGQKAVAMYRETVSGATILDAIPYYLDLSNFLQLPPPSAISGAQSMEFFTCCQMEPRKGLDILLRACELLPEEGWVLTLAGDGKQREHWEAQFGKRWPKERVRFLGRVPFEQRVDAFAGRHVFVFPSRWDGWGMVVPEALAAGLPVISSDRVMSAHEFIENGQNGFVIPTGNPEALACRMSWFLQNASRIPQMSRAARSSLVDYRPEIGAERLVRCAHRLADRQDRFSESDPSLMGSLPSTWKDLTVSSFAEGLPRSGRALAKRFAIHGSLALNPRRKPNGHRILAYHLVLEEDRRRFRDQISFLADHFELCSLVDLIQGLQEQNRDSRNRLAITFDDGFRVLMQDCLELLEKFRIQASFFVSTGFIELWGRPKHYGRFSTRAHPHFKTPLEPMRPEDLQLLVSLGHEVGSHGISHTSFRRMSSAMARRELEISRQKILGWTGRAPRGFAFPYGHTTSRVLKPGICLRSAGYEYGLTLRRGRAEASSDPMCLPRDHCEGNWPVQHLRYFLFS